MILTKRETHIALATAVVAVLAFGYLGVASYSSSKAAIAGERDLAQGNVDKLDLLFARQKKMQLILKDLNAGGLSHTPSEAESQLQDALLEWSSQSGLNVVSLRPEQAATDGKFQQISFHLTGNGPLRTMIELFWRIETTSMPLRVNNLQVKPRTEGQDDLILQLEVSTLCRLPDSKSDRSHPAAGGRGDRT